MFMNKINLSILIIRKALTVILTIQINIESLCWYLLVKIVHVDFVAPDGNCSLMHFSADAREMFITDLVN